tara:strand:- start:1046 stop:1978 length:933 start_codon:yes stop_codon:yes gene_type:complete
VKILLTGSSGFLGKNICEQYWRLEKNKNFKLFDPTSKDLNLLNKESVKKYLKNTLPDFIIHSAGVVGGIQANIANPVKFLTVNTSMANHLINSAYDVGIPYLLNIGSSCMYPKNANSPLKEDYLFNGLCEPTNEGYAISKLYAQRLCQYINIERGTNNYKTIIPCNLYGRWDAFANEKSHMIPAALKKIHEAKINNHNEVLVWGDGTARRENMFASDIAEFIWEIIKKFNLLPDIMNVGMGVDHSIIDYYRYISNIIGYQGKMVYDINKPEGMKQKLVCIERQQELGWMPKTNIVKGLKITYKFFKKHYS